MIWTDIVRTRGRTDNGSQAHGRPCEGLEAPSSGNRIFYDQDVKGFGCRVTAAGARSFILYYRTRGGRERRFTIGRFPEWKTAAARAEAADLKKRIGLLGEDPLKEIQGRAHRHDSRGPLRPVHRRIAASQAGGVIARLQRPRSRRTSGRC